jgi:UDP-3-O-[3-hydroxymyristoyl] N-acetylglucosamine deacetylase
MRLVGGRELVSQTTLRNAISCVGDGLHSGRRIAMRLCPAPADTGIVFRRTDVGGDAGEIPATWDNVVDTQLCTVVANRHDVQVGTVEHLMAALAGCGIDNAIVEVDGPEVPAMDGSASPFVFLIECAGTETQDEVRRAIKVLKPVRVEEEGRVAELRPADGFHVRFDIEFPSRVIGRQSWRRELINGVFKSELARARTFGFLKDVDYLRSVGLALGGSLDNAIVVSGDRILNETGLRYRDEFVRHKALDAVGDLYLAGAPIVGAYHGTQSGHRLTNLLLRTMFADAEAWCRVSSTGTAARSAAAEAEPERALG